jgi:formate-dependent nitrite reductase membrane component NrfD
MLQTTWGWLVAIYLFLGGLGAGAFCAVAILSLASRERFKATVKFGAWASAISIAIGVLVLLIDVGKPFRAMVLFKSFVNFSSWMTIGAWLLFTAILFDGLFAIFWTEKTLLWLCRLWSPLYEKRSLWRTILAGVGIPLNLGVAVYTGVLLGVLPFRPLWHTWLLPALFTASAMDTGLGLVTGFAHLRERADGVERLRKFLEAGIVGLIVIEGTVLGFFLSKAWNGSTSAAQSAQMLINGSLGVVFWVLVVGLGLAIPFLVCLTQLSGLYKRSPLLVPAMGVVACLIGGWTLRFLVLSAGLPAALASPSWTDILAGGVIFLP